MKRTCAIALLGLVAFACAACGGGARQSAGSRSLPAPLLKQIKAEIQKASVIGGAASAKTADVYGPASYAVIDKAWEGAAAGAMTQVSGRWYLIVVHGHFHWNGPVPPGAKLPSLHRDLALVAWSPNAHGLASGGTGYTVVKRVPRAVAQLGVPAAIDLS